jgi:Dihydrodipicolinate synthase/N-acetylneuraminate lyase
VSEIVERTRDAEFDVLSGNDGETLPVLSVGGTGCISVAANVEPERTCRLVRSALEGDYETARQQHHSLGRLFRALFWETNPIPVKAAMEIRGHMADTVRPPLTDLRADNREALREVLADLDRSGEGR